MYSKIIGTGSYLPGRVLTNLELESMVDTTGERILGRTGIARTQSQDLLLLDAFGGGVTRGSALVRL